MIIDITQNMLVDLVNGVSPCYDVFDVVLVKNNGDYNGSYDTWTWNKNKLKELSEAELWELYSICKNSW
jgi:hypothetical protein